MEAMYKKDVTDRLQNDRREPWASFAKTRLAKWGETSPLGALYGGKESLHDLWRSDRFAGKS